MSNRLKVKFTEDALEDINQMTDDMTEEERVKFEEAMKEFFQMVKDGSIIEKSEPVDMDKLKEEDPELYELLVRRGEELKEASEA